ncbi:MAG: VWA domain-containing protein [Marinobacter sp.]|nr:VWA domain-containing protein [Marinobacter sp.]
MADFHFLRPIWLALVLLAPVIALIVRSAARGDSGWDRWIPQPLLAPLIRHRGQKTGASRSPLWPITTAVVVLALALAGPAWREAPTPLKRPGDSLVVVLDLSLSMLATDVKPDRLTRAKRKIRDILDARKSALNALVVYAADAHVVTPLTDDARTIEAMLDVLDPVIMPAQGNRADLAIDQARKLLDQGAPGRGRILLITDDVSDRYQQRIEKVLEGTSFTLSTLTVGTPEGGPIPLAKRGFIRDNGNIVIARSNPDALSSLARQNGGLNHHLTLDNTDIRALELTPSADADWQSENSDLKVERWQDDGYWLLWLFVPLALLGWRRGGFAMLALLIVLPLSPRPAMAASWDSLWQREDQRGPALIEQNPQEAAHELDSPEWKASALYRAGQYQQAADLFKTLKGADADYNRGNALARAGKLKEALAAYDDALDKAPDMKDAQTNRDIVQKLLEQQKSQNQNQQGKDSKKGQNQQDKNNKRNNPSDSSSQNGQSDQSDNQSQSRSGEDSSQTNQDSSKDTKSGQQKKPGDKQDQQNNAQASGAQKDSSDKQPEQQEKQTAEAPAPISEQPLSQGQEQWLRRIPDNPGGLLRRKFLQQYEERQTPSDEGDTPW